MDVGSIPTGGSEVAMSSSVIWLCLLSLLFLLLAAAVAWDVTLIERGKETISRWVLLVSQADPIVAVLFSAPFVFVAGVMAGHWWFPQKP